MNVGARATSKGSLGLSGQPVKPVVSTELNEGPHLRKVKRGSNIEDTEINFWPPHVCADMCTYKHKTHYTLKFIHPHKFV